MGAGEPHPRDRKKGRGRRTKGRGKLGASQSWELGGKTEGKSGAALGTRDEWKHAEAKTTPELTRYEHS